VGRGGQEGREEGFHGKRRRSALLRHMPWGGSNQFVLRCGLVALASGGGACLGASLASGRVLTLSLHVCGRVCLSPCAPVAVFARGVCRWHFRGWRLPGARLPHLGFNAASRRRVLGARVHLHLVHRQPARVHRLHLPVNAASARDVLAGEGSDQQSRQVMMAACTCRSTRLELRAARRVWRTQLKCCFSRREDR